MFREITRKKQAVSREIAVSILKNEKRGVLSVIGDNGYPYGMPMNHFYNEEDGKLYFHSGKKGHRTDSINNCNKASFCVTDGGIKNVNGWDINFISVIVFGKIEIITEKSQIENICRRLSYKFTSDEKYIEHEIEQFADNTLLLCLTPECITGKKVNEA